VVSSTAHVISAHSQMSVRDQGAAAAVAVLDIATFSGVGGAPSGARDAARRLTALAFTTMHMFSIVEGWKLHSCSDVSRRLR
jgi:hypothetical protein